MPVVKTINRNYLNLIANFISFFSLQVGCGGGGGGGGKLWEEGRPFYPWIK